MKSIAASTAKERWPSADVEIEASLGDRRADVLVTFTEHDPRLGQGVAIECQYKHSDKDKEAVTAVYGNNSYSTLWLWPEQFEQYSCDFDSGEMCVWWPSLIPEPSEWSGYHGVVHWVWQEIRPPVELELTIPLTDPPRWFRETLRRAWSNGEGKRRQKAYLRNITPSNETETRDTPDGMELVSVRDDPRGETRRYSQK